MVVVGPELPLALGIVDYLMQKDPELPVFGPSRKAAAIEWSKSFAKELMRLHGIPTAEYQIACDAETARIYAEGFLATDGKAVLKADGLAAGKGVVICNTKEEIENGLLYLQRLPPAASGFPRPADEIVVEKYLDGEEVTFMGFTDGTEVLPLLATQDHKRLLDGDVGPNTGGMGAYTRPRTVTPELEKKMKDIMQNTVYALASERRRYRGAIYGGFMISNGRPYILEWNCRFGDPETQALMPLMSSSLAEPLCAAIEGKLKGKSIKWKPGEALTVVLASKGYPDNYSQHLGKTIRGLEKNYQNVIAYHAGTERRGDEIVNSGGRVLNITGSGYTLKDAAASAYAAIGEDAIHFDGFQFRKDIGHRSLR